MVKFGAVQLRLFIANDEGDISSFRENSTGKMTSIELYISPEFVTAGQSKMFSDATKIYEFPNEKLNNVI